VTGSGVKSELPIAFSLHSEPGTYSLLLGYGVSRAAGVPTGWEVTLNLVRKLTAAQGEDIDHPGAWYRKRFGRARDYYEVVNELAPTRDERRAVLQGYFEPDEQEREEGLKLPTEAHRSIARLCADGYVRLVLTTNFDPLLERALEAEGLPSRHRYAGRSRGRVAIAARGLHRGEDRRRLPRHSHNVTRQRNLRSTTSV
jgi:hypothetical protein